MGDPVLGAEGGLAGDHPVRHDRQRVVDPTVPSPSEGVYVEVAHAVGDETAELHLPFDVTTTPRDLVR